MRASVCEHLHLPLQSGSDATLARMHRGYTAARYLERLHAARAAISDLAVTTDIIVGFPGETEADFVRTLEVAAEADYDAAYTFVFSPRPGTEAALMTDDFVAPEVVQERMTATGRGGRGFARCAATKRGSAASRSCLSKDPSKKDAAIWSGRTRQNKLVHFAPDAATASGRPRRGRDHECRTALLARRTSSAWSKPAPRRRVRIPVAVV